MADVFDAYARYYDLLYKDKDYAGEAAYVHGLIQKYGTGARAVLNLGCGTGKHDACLAKMDYVIAGVDLSETMLSQARKTAVKGKLEFFQGDVRSIDLDREFDAVISLFHVMSYQTADADVIASMGTANRHLKEGGVFIFDFWHGEGVLKDPPVVRVKRLEDEGSRIVRIAQPVMHADRHVIDVNYQIIMMDKRSDRYSDLKETHQMRYFFMPELKEALTSCGFAVREAQAWMSNGPISDAWYGVIVAQKERGL